MHTVNAQSAADVQSSVEIESTVEIESAVDARSTVPRTPGERPSGPPSRPRPEPQPQPRAQHRARPRPRPLPSPPVRDREDFARLAIPYRRELLAHCYRMTGSVHDAEDLVQETYLRAWRAYDRFQGRSSLRHWLYTIATSACLTALEHRSRRVLPAGIGAPGDDPLAQLTEPGRESSWVQPLPDPLHGAPSADPAAVVAERGSVRLALVVALQHLPPRQRVVLILRDVLAWHAAEVAELLGTSTTAVNSALQRARALLARHAPAEDDVAAAPLDAAHRALLERYVRAFEEADVDLLLGLLREDVRLEMPPEPAWFAGRGAVAGFLASRVLTAPGLMRIRRTTANGGQPALATYWLGPGGRYRPHAVQVLALRGGLVAGITVFRDPALFPAFRLPGTLPPRR